MARIEPVYLSRNLRDASPDPHRTYYSHSHSHYHSAPRYRSRGISTKEKVILAGIAGVGIGLIKAGILSNLLNNGK